MVIWLYMVSFAIFHFVRTSSCSLFKNRRILRIRYLVDLRSPFLLPRKSVPFDIPFHSSLSFHNEHDGNCVARIDRASDQTDISNPRKLTDNGTQRSAVATTVAGTGGATAVQWCGRAAKGDTRMTGPSRPAESWRIITEQAIHASSVLFQRPSLASIKANTKGRWQAVRWWSPAAFARQQSHLPKLTRAKLSSQLHYRVSGLPRRGGWMGGASLSTVFSWSREVFELPCQGNLCSSKTESQFFGAHSQSTQI